MKAIDINCDVGEGVGNEPQLMPLISSCNIACGGHAGDTETIRDTIRLAIKNKVRIGAHPGYPDKINFGRVKMDISSEDLKNAISGQLLTFCKILNEENGQLHHIKPHGALYNVIAIDQKLANIFLDAIEAFQHIPLYVPFSSVIQREAKKRNLTLFLEAFADRNYQSDLSLVSRKEKNALIESPKEVLLHVKRMVQKDQVLSVEGYLKEIKADTYCVHGDTPSALKILMYLHQQMSKYNIRIKK